MNIFFYIIIFIIGIMFGSFYTLAVYRIPKKEDITHKHSYCPNCNHKLGFLDLIPLFSYIFLGGKCRYCKQKIRPRYFILELLSGICFVVIAYCMNLNIYNLTLKTILTYAFFVLYLTFLFLIGGIDKENRKIEKSVTVYGIIISIIYIAYLCIVEKANIYRYAIYLFFYVAFLLLDTITLKKFAKSKYINWIMLIIIVMTIFTGEYITMNTIICALLAIAFYALLHNIKNHINKSFKTDKKIGSQISIGFYLVASNIINLLVVLIYYKLIN